MKKESHIWKRACSRGCISDPRRSHRKAGSASQTDTALEFRASQWLSGKESTCNAGDLGLVPWLGHPREGNGYPLQYSCLDNFMDSRAWKATVHGVATNHNWATNTIWNLQSFTGSQRQLLSQNAQENTDGNVIKAALYWLLVGLTPFWSTLD